MTLQAELSSSHGQMVVEVGGLRSQLEKEKSRFRSMQSDLQKELTMAFEENTKLTALMDGKVPSSKNPLIGQLPLGREGTWGGRQRGGDMVREWN